MLLYCERHNQEAVRRALSDAGAREMTFRFDTKGAQVIVNDPFIDGDDTAGCSWRFIPFEMASRKSPDMAWDR